MARLTDGQLLDRLQKLSDRERTTTLDILIHLAEVERRRLHLTLGHSSLFDFATKHLRYSSSAAGRRIQAARAVRRYPEILRLMRERKLNLSTVSMVSRILNDENKTQLLVRLCNRSQRQVEAIVAEYRPVARIRERVQPVRVHERRKSHETRTTSQAVSAPDALAFGVQSSGTALPTTTNAHEASAQLAARDALRLNSRSNDSRSGSAKDESRGLGDEAFKVQFGARPELVRKLEEARALLSGRFPTGVPLAALVEAALDVFLEHKSPARRSARRQARRDAKRNEAREGERALPTARKSRARSIPVAVRDAVYVRDQGRCSFVGTNGRVCETQHDLEIDHIVPFGLGGGHDPANLRLLCARHNRLEVERAYGRAWLDHRVGRRE